MLSAAHRPAPDTEARLDALLDAQDVRLLVEVGFMRLMRGAPDVAPIFAGVIAARPDEDAGHVGLALTYLHAGEADEAAAMLRRRPPSDVTRLFLALALQRQGDLRQASTILTDLAATAADAAHADSARALLAALDAERRP